MCISHRFVKEILDVDLEKRDVKMKAAVFS